MMDTESNAEDVVSNSLLDIEPLPQEQCPLYNRIPAETRSRIFKFALREYEDKTMPFRSNRFYYRPGFRYQTRQDLRLLQTCRLIYQEARLMPLALTEFVYWVDHGPVYDRHNKFPERLDLSMEMTDEQIEAVDTIHVFVSQMQLELCSPFVSPLACRRYKITIRDAGWLWGADTLEDRCGLCPWRSGFTSWEQMKAQPYTLDLQRLWEEIRIHGGGPSNHARSGAWGYELQFIKGLEILEMEFEVRTPWKSKLDDLVDRAKHWKIPMSRGSELRWSGEIKEFVWTGKTILWHDDATETELVPDDGIREALVDGDLQELKLASEDGLAEVNEASKQILIDEAEQQAINEGLAAGENRMTVIGRITQRYYVVKMTWNVQKTTS